MKERNDCEPYDPSHCSGGLAFPRDISVLTDILPYDLKLKSAATRSFLIFFFNWYITSASLLLQGEMRVQIYILLLGLGKKKQTKNQCFCLVQ